MRTRLHESLLRHAISRLRTVAYPSTNDGLVSVRAADLRMVIDRLEIAPAPHHDPATCTAPICREARCRDA